MSGEAPRTTRAARRRALALLSAPAAPLDLRIAGRTLLHAAAVGLAAGCAGAVFFALLERGQALLLGRLAGYEPLRAAGEAVAAARAPVALRPWVLALLPAAGALVSGVLTCRFAPEAAGGGGNGVIAAYHHGAVLRRRLAFVKGAAAVATLASGGSGGREGPTMQIGGAIGAWVARALAATERERRVLVVSGIAAGISAVFRTPLGAALLATEVLYRDDFESDALVPAILASVASYSVAVSVFGEATLFGHLPRFAFVPVHLPLFVALALVVALGAVSFVSALRLVERSAARWPVPAWAKPALGGLAMGLFGTAVLLAAVLTVGPAAARVGVFGGGYGIALLALTGAGALRGWALVILLAALGFAKCIASALTIGSGAAAGDFAPSLVMGGLLGGAFGHAAALALGDPRIDPAAFALVGMGTFYGGIAHAPLAAVVIVCELAGSYDLLVPMMAAVATALVLLRRWSLYPAQRRSRAADAPEGAAAPAPGNGALGRTRAGEMAVAPEVAPVAEGFPLRALAAAAAGAREQRVIAVVGSDGAPRGLVEIRALRDLDDAALEWAVAADLMGPFASVEADASGAEVAERLRASGAAQAAVLEGGRIRGWVGEAELVRAWAAAERGEPPR